MNNIISTTWEKVIAAVARWAALTEAKREVIAKKQGDNWWYTALVGAIQIRFYVDGNVGILFEGEPYTHDIKCAYYAKPLEKLGSLSPISLKAFAQLVNCCTSYDPFTSFIDNYRDMKRAEATNELMEKRFNAILTEQLGEEWITGIPGFGKDANKCIVPEELAKWLGARGIGIYF